jgi:hypothetical protein
MSWSSELSAAETAENAYRAAAKGSFLNNYFRLDARANVLLNDWIRARAAVSSVGVQAGNSRYWGNVAARAVTAMGPSWSVVQNQPLASLFGETSFNSEMASHAPFGFVDLDGLFGGLITDWARNVYVASGRTLGYGFPDQEVWSYLLANTLTIAGAT